MRRVHTNEIPTLANRGLRFQGLGAEPHLTIVIPPGTELVRHIPTSTFCIYSYGKYIKKSSVYLLTIQFPSMGPRKKPKPNPKAEPNAQSTTKAQENGNKTVTLTANTPEEPESSKSSPDVESVKNYEASTVSATTNRGAIENMLILDSLILPRAGMVALGHGDIRQLR